MYKKEIINELMEIINEMRDLLKEGVEEKILRKKLIKKFPEDISEVNDLMDVLLISPETFGLRKKWHYTPIKKEKLKK